MHPVILLLVAFIVALPQLGAQQVTPLHALTASVSNGVVTLNLPVFAHIDDFSVFASDNLAEPFLAQPSEHISGYTLAEEANGLKRFYRIAATAVSSNDLLSAIVLNRLAYGPTPEDSLRLKQIGPQAYIDEQLHPERIVEDPSLAPGAILPEGWEFFSMTGRPIFGQLQFLTDDAGPIYIDDVRLVQGTMAGIGRNLLRNGDFEHEFQPSEWDFGRDYWRSRAVTNRAYSGSRALLLQGEYNHLTDRDFARWFLPEPLDPNETYTLSFWHYRQNLRPNLFAVALLEPWWTSPDTHLGAHVKLRNSLAWPADLRAYHTLRAINARRQLLEVLLQFFDNHFVTAFAKNYDYIGHHIHSGPHMIIRPATDLEFKELERWRSALLKPDCTFRDLLKISCESLAMVMFLDTISSSSLPDLNIIPNENYARELLELFTFGVDNGYDQEDVTIMSRVWSGWRINVVDPDNEYNPLAPRTLRRITEFEDIVDRAVMRHEIGVFSVSFVHEVHNPSEKILFSGKKVPPRFGDAYAGRSYELRLPARTGPLGVQDGYDVISHLADQPFTQEFISVKLCRLFVHDDFSVGYDFTSPFLSAEGRLVRDCMAAWEANLPKGQIRKVLEVIFSSDLFRTQNAAFQKFKTPLEFVASAIRALRIPRPDGTYTAETDGYSLEGPLDRLGQMNLFDRELPDGYPEVAGPMMNVSALVERIRWIQSFLSPPGSMRNSEAGASVAFPVDLIKALLPSAKWNDAGSVADLFLSSIYPGWGKATLDVYRSQAVHFLNTGQDGASVSEFANLPPSGDAYDLRVRGMVAHLMSLDQFNQQ